RRGFTGVVGLSTVPGEEAGHAVVHRHLGANRQLALWRMQQRMQAGIEPEPEGSDFRLAQSVPVGVEALANGGARPAAGMPAMKPMAASSNRRARRPLDRRLQALGRPFDHMG
ncbi:MAG TPA: hypothetical protein VLH79_03860, partial [Chthonomonadales bacterium]|nr:hypothetical protein [Chthonomonadales bacterium]